MNNIKSSYIELLQEVINKAYIENVQQNMKMTQEQRQMESNSNIKCKKCGHEVFEYYVQTRSSDEAATGFYKCINPQCSEYKAEKRI